MTPEEKLFKDIQERIKGSGAAAIAVCEWLCRQGFDAEVLPMKIAPSYNERLDYLDSGDIRITINGVDYRYEVKNRTFNFNSVQNFRYPSIIIDEARKVRKEHDMPLWGYAIVSKDLKGFISIRGSTQEHWFDKEKFDKNLGKDVLFTLCPKLAEPMVKYINMENENE